MSEESGFFTSVTGDRKYTARFMNEKLHEALQRAEGVVPGADGELEVSTDGSLAVRVAPGTAFKGGIYHRTPDTLTLALEAPSLGTQRYDRVAVRIDRYGRTMKVSLIPGVEGLEPVPPDYLPDDDVPLAKVLINRTEDPPVVSISDERQMRPRFLTDRNSMDDLTEGTQYGRVLKEKADAINMGQTGVSFRQFILTSRPWDSAYIECVLMLPNNMIIMVGRSDDVKLSVSNDAGVTWKNPSGIDIDNKILSIAACGSTFLAAGGAPSRIYKSGDWGSNWTLAFEDTGQEFTSALLAFDYLTAIAVSGSSVYATANAGSTWTLRGSFPDNYMITALENLGNGVLLAAGYSTNKIWRSTDSGATWTAVATTDCIQRNASLLRHVGNGVVLLGYSGGGYLYRSADYGLTWSAGIRINSAQNYYGIYTVDDTIYLPINKELYLSNDGGVTWTPRYSRANWSDIMAVGANVNGEIVTLGYSGHVFWGYLMEG